MLAANGVSDDWAEAFKATGWSPGGGASAPGGAAAPGAPAASASAIGDDWVEAFKATGWSPSAPSPAGPATASAPPPRAASTGGGAPALGAAPPGAQDVEGYIRSAAAQRGIDPDVAVRVAQSEGGLVPNRTGSFSTGKSFWPFQLHYGGAGTPYASYGTVAGMGNSFTAQTGWQPGDPNAWQAATDYALDQAKRSGWGQWYGARNQGITGFQGISARGGTPQGPADGAVPAGGRDLVERPGTAVARQYLPDTGAGASGDDWSAAFRRVGWTPEGSPAPGGSSGSSRTTGGAGAFPVTTASGAPAGTVPATTARQATAAAWALSQMGSKAFYNLCERFIEQAYGTGSQFGSAAAAGKALFKTANPAEADVGDLVFFRPDASNGYAGHAAINLGNGEMVGATYGGVTRDNYLTNPYWRNLLVGFGDPPDQWQGRSGGTSSPELLKGAEQLVQTGQRAAGAVGGAAGGAVGSAVGGIDLGDWASAFRRAGWSPGA